MAQKKKGGLISRLIMGTEKSEEYARNSLPSNRWELFWDILKGSFWKLVIVNLLILLFCIPLAALLFFRSVAVMNYGATYPFAQCFGLGYLAPSTMAGYAESIVFQVDMIIYLLLPIAIIFLALGVSGGAYVIRNMVWTEGIFVANDFWKGIKQNFKQIVLIGLTFSLVFYITIISIGFCEQNIAIDVPYKWMYIVFEVLSFIILIAYSIMTLHMITMSVTYELKFIDLIKNSFLFTISLAPINIFFIICCALPFLLLFLGGIFRTIAIIAILLLGASYILLVWTDYSHWIYDKFINDKVPGAKKNRGIYDKVSGNNNSTLNKYKEQTLVRTTFNSRPIKPITDDELQVMELPTTFSRDDLLALSQSKQAIYDDHAKYVEEHMNDPEIVKMNAPQETDVEREKRIERAKKELADRDKK